MPWLWSDELARLLIEQGEASASQLRGWIDRPIGFAAEGDPLDLARRLLLSEEEGGRAA